MLHTRLDQFLVIHHELSRARAQSMIKSGHVLVNDAVVTKASATLPKDAIVTLKQDYPYVSRAGMKLAHALEQCNINPAGMVALDVGASTGGFTDVLLQAGAKKVYAVDVGHGQLHPSLLDDARVISLEHTNARYLEESHIAEAIDILVCDASFISLKLILPAPLALCKDVAHCVTLIKPQFEVGKERISKDGVVKDPALQEAVCEGMRRWMNAQPEWQVQNIIESPIMGAKGNVEFLMYATKNIQS
jgi:23S rRNA (cytidine1920-2'-O)/16S rRNA (cytidine1409-2'-O)-methyltransferase